MFVYDRHVRVHRSLTHYTSYHHILAWLTNLEVTILY